MSIKSFDIYFSDLNEEAQHNLLVVFDIDTPEEANIDIDIIPLATVEVENDTGKAEEDTMELSNASRVSIKKEVLEW